MDAVRLSKKQWSLLASVRDWDDGVGFYVFPDDRARARSLIKRGLLVSYHADDGSPPQFVSVTDAGRAALASMEAK